MMELFTNFLASDALGLCPLETSADEYTLITSAGDLVSVFQVDGVYEQVSAHELIRKLEILEVLLNGVLEYPYHEIQWVQARTKRMAEDVFADYRDQAISAADSIGLDKEYVETLIDEHIGTLRPDLLGETGYLVLITRNDILPPSVLKRAKHQDAQILKKIKTKKFSSSEQSLFGGYKDMLEPHRSQAQVIANKLRLPPLNFVIQPLKKHAIVRMIARLHNPEIFDKNWQPRLPGDPLPIRRFPGRPVRNYHPTIERQVFRGEMQNSGAVCKVGSKWHGPVYVYIPPKKAESFNELVRQIPKEIEWRLSISLLGGKNRWLGKVKNRRFWTSLIKLLNSSHNTPILDSADTLIELTRMGEQLCGIRIAATVIADTKEVAIKQQAILLRALQSWGFCDAALEEGFPLYLDTESLPAMDNGRVAPVMIAPLQESTFMLPMARPASPWRGTGLTLFHTLQMTPYEYREGGSKQSYSVALLFAQPGSGKSVMINLLNLASCLSPGQSRLPRIVILDIGKSSWGLINLLKAMLPDDRKHEAEAYAMRDSREFAINPFDTLLGVRGPVASEKAFLLNFITLLLTPSGKDEVPQLVAELSSALIAEAYRYYSEKSPKRYEPDLEDRVDRLLTQYPDLVELSSKNRLTWWEIVDRFMADEHYTEAGLAQRHAVPLLPDLPQVLSESRTIQDTYGKKEDLLQMTQIMLESAIRDYPILTEPTRFNPSSARVVALDLMDAAKSSTGYERKRAGLMYMLGRHALAREFYYDETVAEHFTPAARKYHMERLRRERTSIKRIVFDEYHRTSALESVRGQVITDAREARKFNVQIVLASQLYEDFGSDLQELASTLMVLKADSEKTRKKLIENFSMNEAASYALRHHVHGASSQGASFLLWSRLKDRSFTQTLVSRIGPMMLWAFSTTPEDAALRERLADLVGHKRALEILGKAIPGASIQGEIEKMLHTSDKEAVDQYILKRAEQLAMENGLG